MTKPDSAIMARATAFFAACESGRARQACAPYRHPGAGFAAQAVALEGVTTPTAYADWMEAVCRRIPDPGYRLRAAAADEARSAVLIFGGFTGTAAAETDAPAHPFSTDYVYAIGSDGDKIAHMTKIWNDGCH